jgi:hypothetical protein
MPRTALDCRNPIFTSSLLKELPITIPIDIRFWSGQLNNPKLLPSLHYQSNSLTPINFHHKMDATVMKYWTNIIYILCHPVLF